MVVKIAGGIFVIMATSLFGWQSAAKIRQEYKELLYLQRIMYLLQSEIRYARSYLGEAFLHTGKRVRQPYQKWLLQMSRQLEQKNNGIFRNIWEAGVSECLSEIELSKEEKERLVELGDQFATSDIEMQMKTLELYQEQVSISLKEKKEGMQTKIRLCHCLGIMSGIFLTILLL